ncbi:MAG: ABC transporter ATP-binding protein, partial [Erysipelotrichaceae bacterium]|nr:ABC transporter ATP-binding protein [Erysipelotrichaceae bacterium]
MLQIKNISKTYKTGSLVQQALDNVSLNLRDNEFVAILGPSGSGKTTLLNIIGGLDRYDEGDLIINNVSTKNYKDRDWDTYRNHTIGFVFQSYNLIPHQSILSNVELALTIGGISGKERKQRALKALAEVGLEDQAHKRPNQMSGGQMQRVAIARALVNNPDILLADEPTGALDSKTSVQVMELLKKVANDRLVVMVTHNPELASEYANRIVNLKDGKIISDSNPFNVPDIPLQKKTKKVKKAHMSYLTAFSLSFNNLLTKKGRTLLTAFAGSIGIIGIALILSLSTGFQNYIDKIQEDTLSSYPLTINSETADTTSAILSMVADRRENQTEGDVVRERQYLTTMFSSIGSNDLRSLKKYLEEHEAEYADYVTNINYTYSIKPLIYTIDAADKIVKLNPSSLLSSIYSSSATSMISAFSSGGGSIFAEMNDDIDSYKDQYDVLAGRWPENFDEMIIVLSEPNSISDLLVYSLGLRDTSELKTIITNVMAGEEAGVENEPQEFTYSDLMNIDMRLVLAPKVFKYNVQYNVYEDMSGDEAYMKDIYSRSLKLKIVGIMCAKDDSSALSTGVNYRKALTQYVIDECGRSSIVEKQLRNKDTDVFSNKHFDEENEDDEKKLDFQDMISVDEDMLKNAFKVNVKEDDFKFDMISEDQMADIVFSAAKDAANMINNSPDRTTILGLLTAVNTQLLTSKITTYEMSHVTIIEGEGTFLQLKNDDLNAIADSIDAQAYKDAVKDLINVMKETNPDIAQMSELINILNDSQYARLAQGIKAMFLDYYSRIMKDQGFIKDEGSEDGKIAYAVDMTNNTVTYGTTLTNTSLLLTETTTNETALANTAQVANEIMENLLTYMIAAQIGVATGKIMTPMAESLSSLGDLFSNDLMSVDTDAFS